MKGMSRILWWSWDDSCWDES